MTAHKGFFRNAFDALIEARTREAARHVAAYTTLHTSNGVPTKSK